MALTDKLTAIANAIRAKTGSTAALKLDAMPDAIASIQTGITPSGTKYIYENGTYDVTNYATASVMIESPTLVYEQVYGSGTELALPKGAEGAKYFVAVSSYKLPEADVVNAVFATPKDKLTATYTAKGGQQQVSQDVTLKNGVITLADKGLSFDKSYPYNVVAWG